MFCFFFNDFTLCDEWESEDIFFGNTSTVKKERSSLRNIIIREKRLYKILLYQFFFAQPLRILEQNIISEHNIRSNKRYSCCFISLTILPSPPKDSSKIESMSFHNYICNKYPAKMRGEKPLLQD